MESHDTTSHAKKIKAYAILAGGGVKGAALVGGLRAAEDHGIEFVGYGGASAGSIVALLASLGYEGDELEQIILETDFSNLLDDETGKELGRLKKLGSKRFTFPLYVGGNYKLLNRIRNQFGLYQGHRLEEFLLQKITKKHPELNNVRNIFFHHLTAQKCKLLKIIVSDISQRKALVFSANRVNEEINGKVVNAIRASIGYPFVFKPVEQKTMQTAEETVQTEETRYLVDGGLSSNLPVFLFAREHKQTHLPVLAFDLILPDRGHLNGKKYRLKDFCGDLIATALEASDDLHRQTITDYTKDVIYIPIKVPQGIDTLKFSLTEDERISLYNAGYRCTRQALDRELRNLPSAKTKTETVQAMLNVPTSLVQPLLKAMVREVEEKTPARSVRSHIMLPKGENTLIVAYQYGMDDRDPDKEFEVAMTSRWAAKVFYDHEPTLSDLNKLRAQPNLWGLDDVQVERIRPDRQTLLSVPLLEARASAPDVTDLDCFGVLSIDTETPLTYTSRGTKVSPSDIVQSWAAALDIVKKWADIVSRVLQ